MLLRFHLDGKMENWENRKKFSFPTYMSIMEDEKVKG